MRILRNRYCHNYLYQKVMMGDVMHCVLIVAVATILPTLAMHNVCIGTMVLLVSTNVCMCC
jgi:hypothetical protein